MQSVQNALTADGITASVAAQVMDGTTLHQIVTGENKTLPPTNDQFKSDPGDWIVVNFDLDDMWTPASDPAQQAALDQFVQDLTVFAQRAALAGKPVFAVMPIRTCETEDSASVGLAAALTRAQSNGAPVQLIGQIPQSFTFDSSGKAVSSPDVTHLAPNCASPDNYLQTERVQSAADSLAARYKSSSTAATAGAASGASAAGT
ncbi:hypothetical protein BTH42_17040 [Burkholderia sp. SRS-W-2-2016]|nr:hypothetical protein BTH42_17040 [Burkholderia sp. SRS-W-2-2016]